MLVKDLIEKIDNGAANIIIWGSESGEIFLSTIWYNTISKKYLEAEIVHLVVRDYELRIEIKENW